MSLKDLHSVLQNVVDRSEAQKDIRVAKMRAELIEYGYSIVTSEWLNEVLREMPLAGRTARE